MAKKAAPILQQMPIPSDRRRAYRLRRYHYMERYDLVGLESMHLESQLEQENKKLKAQADVLHERLVRARADFENFRKRTSRERSELVEFANADLIAQLLPVLDHFGLAISSSAAAADVTALLEGVHMIQGQLLSVLGALGLEQIEAQGETFNPHLHEAVGVEEAPGKKENTVVEVLRPGYKLKAKVLRPAMVKVSKSQAAPKREK